MRWLALAVVATSCTPLGDVPSGVCGNGVLEPGEDCDAVTPSCGRPDTTAACRVVCAADRACPSGLACGVDGVCRTPSGKWRASPFFGHRGSSFQLLDLERVGFPGVVERSANQLTWYRNQNGVLSPFASGDAPSPNSGDGLSGPTTTTVAAAQLAHDPGALATLALFHGAELTLQEVRDDATLSTLLLPAFAAPLGQHLLGLFADSDGTPLIVYVTDGLQVMGLLPVGDHTPRLLIDMSSCASPPNNRVLEAHAPVGAHPLEVALRLGDGVHNGSVCWASPTHPPVVLPLGDGYTPAMEGPSLLDLDGNGLVDAYALDVDPAPDQGRWMWLQTQPGTFNGPFHGNVNGGSPAPDLNYDLRDDFFGDGALFVNDGLDSPMTSDQRVSQFDDGLGGFVSAQATTRLDRYGPTDLLFGAPNGGLSVCLSDGGGGPRGLPRVACQVQQSGLSTVNGLGGADVNGDGTTDIVAWSDSQIALALGRPFTFPDAASVVATTDHAQLRWVSRLPRTDSLAERLLAALTLSDGTSAVALSGSTQAAFPVATAHPVWDTRFFDDDGDGHLDLLVLDETGVEIYAGLAAGGFSPTARHVALDPAPQLTTTTTTGGMFFYSVQLRFADLPDESAPAILWEEDQIVIARRRGSGYLQTRFDVPRDHVSDPNLPAQVSYWLQDLDGDGRVELLMLSQDLSVGTFTNADLPSLRSFIMPKGTFFLALADMPPFDGRADLVLDLIGDPSAPNPLAGTTVAYGQPDGSFDFEHLSESDLQAGLLDANPRWLTTRDLNGDGIADLLMKTDRGAVVLFADVVRR
jgi:hypothetical protein